MKSLSRRGGESEDQAKANAVASTKATTRATGSTAVIRNEREYKEALSRLEKDREIKEAQRRALVERELSEEKVERALGPMLSLDAQLE